MCKSRFTKEQNVGILKESEICAKVDELTPRHGMSPAVWLGQAENEPKKDQQGASWCNLLRRLSW